MWFFSMKRCRGAFHMDGIFLFFSLGPELIMLLCPAILLLPTVYSSPKTKIDESSHNRNCLFDYGEHWAVDLLRVLQFASGSLLRMNGGAKKRFTSSQPPQALQMPTKAEKSADKKLMKAKSFAKCTLSLHFLVLYSWTTMPLRTHFFARHHTQIET